jgi:hypothetical protein
LHFKKNTILPAIWKKQIFCIFKVKNMIKSVIKQAHSIGTTLSSIWLCIGPAFTSILDLVVQDLLGRACRTKGLCHFWLYANSTALIFPVPSSLPLNQFTNRYSSVATVRTSWSETHSHTYIHTHSRLLCLNNGDGYAENQRHRRWGNCFLYLKHFLRFV